MPNWAKQASLAQKTSTFELFQFLGVALASKGYKKGSCQLLAKVCARSTC